MISPQAAEDDSLLMVQLHDFLKSQAAEDTDNSLLMGQLHHFQGDS